jgi:putative transcriptional regulator
MPGDLASFPALIRAAGALLLVLLLAGERPANGAQDAASGIFLVAAPRLQDPNFRETVVLVTQPSRGGPYGVIINRPLEHKLGELFPRHEGLKARDDTIFLGGPVARQGLVFLVRAVEPPPEAVAVLRDVYLTGNIEWVNERLQMGDLATGLRVYAGHSGWARGQLQNEIGRGDWFVLPADPEAIFSKDPASIWPELSKRAALRSTRASPAARILQPL